MRFLLLGFLQSCKPVWTFSLWFSIPVKKHPLHSSLFKFTWSLFKIYFWTIVMHPLVYAYFACFIYASAFAHAEKNISYPAVHLFSDRASRISLCLMTNLTIDHNKSTNFFRAFQITSPSCVPTTDLLKKEALFCGGAECVCGLLKRPHFPTSS